MGVENRKTGEPLGAELNIIAIWSSIAIEVNIKYKVIPSKELYLSNQIKTQLQG